ncbi:hypothetical protein IG631_05795 [Alternaria alternata]|nr:hypothetical protein IG631_05795 [Alternaria alternata]
MAKHFYKNLHRNDQRLLMRVPRPVLSGLEETSSYANMCGRCRATMVARAGRLALLWTGSTAASSIAYIDSNRCH